jgi:hypothetical protein
LREQLLLVLHERGVLRLLAVRVRRRLLLALIRWSVRHRRRRRLLEVRWEVEESSTRPLASLAQRRSEVEQSDSFPVCSSS